MSSIAFERSNKSDTSPLTTPRPWASIAEAIVTGNIQTIGALIAARETSAAAAELAIAEITIKNHSTGSIKQLVDLFKRNRKAFEDAIHSCKENWPTNAAEKPHIVVVDKLTGEVCPLPKNGRLGDSIGNIVDALAGK